MGVVLFVGPTHFAKGIWVGIGLPDKTGKNDGCVRGERYFVCAAGHGLFVRLSAVEKDTPASGGHAL